MGGMTTDTGGGYKQTTLQKTLPMDTHLVIVKNFLLVALIGERGLPSILMASTTKIGNVLRVYG